MPIDSNPLPPDRRPTPHSSRSESSTAGHSVEEAFYYFAYGSCMCPVDLKRSLGEATHSYVVGAATLSGYRLGFYRRSRLRQCGVLDILPDGTSTIHGVLYRLPLRLSPLLDAREEGYHRHAITVECNNRRYAQTRTYTVSQKLTAEIAPNDWYFDVVMRGALTCGLPEQYCWQLFHHMHSLQQQATAVISKYSAARVD